MKSLFETRTVSLMAGLLLTQEKILRRARTARTEKTKKRKNRPVKARREM